MPYISQVSRERLNPLINHLARLVSPDEVGEVNYIISRLIYLTYGDRGYPALNAGLGVLEAVKQEFYRRVVVPYEEQKKEERGDVFQ